MSDRLPHWQCPDCRRWCSCLFPQALHDPCERQRVLHLVVEQGPIPKPGKKPKKDRKWPEGLHDYIVERDQGCVAHRLQLGRDRPCFGKVQVDHVRHSGGIGMKSPTEAWNLVSLCGQHHYSKTVHEGGDWRPVLIKYLQDIEEDDHP